MGQGNNSALQGQLNQYAAPLPDVAQAYLRSFQRGGPIDIPSYQELYGSYRDVAQREANRQAAGLTEAFGSQGARYSSDLLAGQGRLKENLFQDLTNQSGQFLTGLRQQQFNEGNAINQLQYGINESAMQRLFQDFLRRTSPPPLLGQAQQFIQGFGYGTPTNVVY